MVLLVAMLFELILCMPANADGYHRVCNWSQRSLYRRSVSRNPDELMEYWDHSIEETGLDAQKFIIVNQANNVLMDLVILVLQIPVIWNLRRVWQDKLALNGVFALGAFVCFASINRIVALFWIILTDPAFTVYQTTL
ncbi:hypothetical protein PDIDSM_127 [Penicillium digitatum]|nr:hypothetical protein PDIDSM_127 [Penicillium digitatum]